MVDCIAAAVMSQCSLDEKVEVTWDHDSPTPAVWKRLQGPPIRRDEDCSTSPTLPRVTRKVAPMHFASLDYPQFERSKQEANRIINALRKASRENDNSQPVCAKLNIPEISEDCEDSDDELLDLHTVPFGNLANSSLDVIFNLSGNGEELPATLKSTFKTQPVAPPSPSSDAWTDDDIFTEEVLLQVDKELKRTPMKPQASHKTEDRSLEKPIKSSTPYAPRDQNRGDKGPRQEPRKVKNFLNFMMETPDPPKPSPKKHKAGVLKKSFSDLNKDKNANAPTHKNHVHPSKCNRSTTMPNCSAQKTKEDAKPANISIPLEVLEDFMMDDSFAEIKDTKSVPSTPKTVVSPVKTTCNPNINSVKHASNGKPTTAQCSSKSSTSHGRSTEASNPCKLRRTETGQAQCSVSSKPCQKNVTAFSSDDDDLLLEAVALTESQGKSKEAKEKPVSQSHKCTAAEIERKKQMALNRRKLKMKQNRVASFRS